MRFIFNYRSLAYLVVFLLAIGCTDEVEEGAQPDTAEFTGDVNPQNLLEISFTNLSEKATHYGPHLAGVVTYEILNDGRDVAPLASGWDGRVHHSFEAEELPALPATQNRAIAGN